MNLQEPTDSFIQATLRNYESIEGDELNIKLQKLFNEFSDDKNKYDVLIKVAALNKIYSTAITNITPVVDKINNIANLNANLGSIDSYINLVDKISLVEWTNNKNDNFKRNNLSFASKYVHFLSNREIPIYDSYIWIIIQAYLGQKNQVKILFTNPKDYQDFYATFCRFKTIFGLEGYSNYKIDKFLWTYGRELIKSIEGELNLDVERAKLELKRRIKKSQAVL
ncbi:hypothetical protein [Pedobacter borealis]|uniref:hypothetical protein n=1 Tax=Pedobacter borealis TaxID=475254 RepID=UPI0004935F60|nr:hypothetical protein [Pedobacter borealis]